MSSCQSPIIVALDVQSQQQALALAGQLDASLCRVKVGNELFTAAGPELIKNLHVLGFEVFLDLKYYDIPNTVAQALVSAAKLGVWMVNVHASGGAAMMETALQAVHACAHPSPMVIAVTVLTSMDDVELEDTGVSQTAQERVLHLARLTKKSGLHGVVCSAQEAQILKQEFGEEFVLVTPGIRPNALQSDDQKRVMTPSQAMAAGSDYLVIGRPITQANDPLLALRQILQDL